MFSKAEVTAHLSAKSTTEIQALLLAAGAPSNAKVHQFFRFAGDPILQWICAFNKCEMPTPEQLGYMFLAMAAAELIEEEMIDKLAAKATTQEESR